MKKTWVLAALALTAVLVEGRTARAESTLELAAYDDLVEGNNFALETRALWGFEPAMFYAYSYGNQAAEYAAAAIKYNNRQYWLDAYNLAYEAQRYAWQG
jgi:hypothetical protein